MLECKLIIFSNSCNSLSKYLSLYPYEIECLCFWFGCNLISSPSSWHYGSIYLLSSSELDSLAILYSYSLFAEFYEFGYSSYYSAECSSFLFNVFFSSKSFLLRPALQLGNPLANFSSISAIDANRDAIRKNSSMKNKHSDWVIKPYYINGRTLTHFRFDQSFPKLPIHIVILLVSISLIFALGARPVVKRWSPVVFSDCCSSCLDNRVRLLWSTPFFFHPDWKFCVDISRPGNIATWLLTIIVCSQLVHSFWRNKEIFIAI